MRIGQGYDVHALVQGRKLVVGGVTIPFEKGLAGHSDADVLIHAVCDALLGAAALGDIGLHFPDTDPKHRNANSRVVCWICEASANSSRRCESVPHRSGDAIPAGGGTYLPMTRNSCPRKPSGVQLASPIRPPGRHTRISSLAAHSWAGANITPKVDRTTSKLPVE